MPDERAASEAARRKKAAERQGKVPPVARPISSPVEQSEPAHRGTLLKVIGWVAFAGALALFVVFVVFWVHGDIPKSEQLYPLPGIASVLLIVGIWTVLGPWLYKSRSTGTRVGKYVLAVVLTVAIYPAVVTIVSTLAQWIVSLIPGSPLH